MRALLAVEGLTKRFGGIVALNRCSIEVAEGSITALIGPNGSGKTTLFNLVTGYLPPDSGSIFLDGKSLRRADPAKVARLGVLRTFQQARIFPQLTVQENLAAAVHQPWWGTMYARVRPAERVRALELLDEFGLGRHAELPAIELSYGQQKLLEFAMALMSGPRMLLLDEPTAGINPTLINGLLDRLRRVNQELGIALLVIEHNMRVIMELAEYIYCLAHGELLAQGKPEQIQSDQRVLDAYLGAH